MFDDDLADKAVARVRRWLSIPQANRSKSAAQLAHLLEDPQGLQFAIDFVDRVIRPEDRIVAGREFSRLAHHAPAFLGRPLQAAVRLGGVASSVLPQVTVPLARAAMRHMIGHLVIDATEQRLGKHLQRLRHHGVQLNLNLLGEAVLGTQQAAARLRGTEELLSRPDVDYVSIKVSSVAPQLNMWAFDETVDEVVSRLTPLYRIAVAQQKFINLDMEEYRDVDLTLAVFENLLSLPEFHRLHAGIVVQAYLPDALGVLKRLTSFAQRRVEAGGAPIKVRLVKGANLPMERVDAAVHGWPLATCASKQASDANYKRLLHWALQPAHAAVVRIGVAGHNLFDVAYALELADRYDTRDAVDIEMLLGMADDHLDAVRAEVSRVVLYTPVVRPREFDAAVAYLIRRLEENGSPENFMSAMFRLNEPDAFAREEQRFRASLALLAREDAESEPTANRRQDRRRDAGRPHYDQFGNEPDTDMSLAANREWASDIATRISTSDLGSALVHDCARVDDAEELLAPAAAAASQWRCLGADERRRILYQAAEGIARHRSELIEVMAHETGKTMAEGDVEVSEAIDFCRYYADRSLELESATGATARPVDVVVVVSPWNFPCAIPCGGVMAALATGASVILKPAPQAARTAAVLVDTLWQAGVPREVLHLAPVGESDVARDLVTDPRVGRVIFTGSTDTAALFSSWRPDVRLLGETSGKNGIIVMPDADLDLAAADVARSAFGHAGQKCSAASLGIMVGSVARSRRFLDQLVDAVTTLRVGYPDDPRAHVGPIIEPASGKLARALRELEPGEQWLLPPEQLDDEGRLWRPGIRTGVRPGSYTHRTEFFGPHLSLIAARSLDEAIAIQNGTDFGLTAGLHSLDPRAASYWLERIDAGNCYINRGITGAIVQRQPFGGWKQSQVGPGTKAGGPNYLMTLVDWEPTIRDSDDSFLSTARADDERAWKEHFTSSDISALAVERNVLRYRPSNDVVVRFTQQGSVVALRRVLAAADRVGATIQLSTSRPVDIAANCIADQAVEDDATFHRRLADPHIRRIRLVGSDPQLRELLAQRPWVAVYDQPVTVSARIEMLPFVREQSVSITAHRYGNPDPRFVTVQV